MMSYLDQQWARLKIAQQIERFAKEGEAFKHAKTGADQVVSALEDHNRVAEQKVASGHFTGEGLVAALASSRNSVAQAARNMSLDRARKALAKRREELAKAGEPNTDAMPSQGEADAIRRQIGNATNPEAVAFQHADDAAVMAVVAHSHPLSLGMSKAAVDRVLAKASQDKRTEADREANNKGSGAPKQDEEMRRIDLVLSEIDNMERAALAVADQITEKAKADNDKRQQPKQSPKRRPSNPAMAATKG